MALVPDESFKSDIKKAWEDAMKDVNFHAMVMNPPSFYEQRRLEEERWRREEKMYLDRMDRERQRIEGKLDIFFDTGVQFGKAEDAVLEEEILWLI